MLAGILGQISSKMVFATIVGLIGAAICTYWEIANTTGPRERAFMVRACVWFWIANCIFVAAMWLVPKPYNWIFLPLYIVPLLIFARYCNRRCAAIRLEESNDEDLS